MGKTKNQITKSVKFKGRVSIFIDAANILYSQKTLGWEIDYKKVMTFFKKNSKLKEAYFYSGIISSNKKQTGFFSKMEKFGYIVRTKEVKWIKSKQGKIIKGKGNLDIELALDMSQTHRHYDTAALFSGDSDFEPIISFLKSKGKRVYVFSTRGHISRELIRASDMYVPFEKTRSEFERKNHPRRNAGGKSIAKIIPKRAKKVK